MKITDAGIRATWARVSRAERKKKRKKKMTDVTVSTGACPQPPKELIDTDYSQQYGYEVAVLSFLSDSCDTLLLF